jgi:hypothetical protein
LQASKLVFTDVRAMLIPMSHQIAAANYYYLYEVGIG